MNHVDVASAFKKLPPDGQARVLTSIKATRERPERFLVTFRFVSGTVVFFSTAILDRSPVEFMANKDLHKTWFPDAVPSSITIVNVHSFRGREHIKEGRFQ